MTGRALFLLTTLALAVYTTAYTPYVPGTDPSDEEINFYAFQQRWSISGAKVATLVGKADSITERGLIPSTSGPGQSIFPLSIPRRCEDGPVTGIFRKPGIWYWPAPPQKTCADRCPRGHECVATKTAIKQVWAITYKQFQYYGAYSWAPIGIRLLCITDELTCACKPICKPFYCFPPRRFNSQLCDCECPPITCRYPYEQDPVSCQCRCAKNIVCDTPKILDPKSCGCVCPPVHCPPGYKVDPKTCRCIITNVCSKRCPTGSYLDRATCHCVGTCRNYIDNEYNCNAIDSHRVYTGYKCRWYPTFPQSRCQCECCQPKPGYENYDCGQWTPHGNYFCKYYRDPHTSRQPCKWVCGS